MLINAGSTLAVITAIILVTTFSMTTPMVLLQQAEAWTDRNNDGYEKAPADITGENV
jgi:hypothetical protein